MKFEDFMTAYLGDTGIFQVLILCIAWLNAFTGNETFAHNFIGGEQEHWCLVPELQDVPHAQQKYIAIPYDSEGLYDSCSFFNMSYDGYSVTDYYYWNRTVHETSNTVPCEDWVYDQSEYLNTLTSEVCPLTSTYNANIAIIENIEFLITKINKDLHINFDKLLLK